MVAPTETPQDEFREIRALAERAAHFANERRQRIIDNLAPIPAAVGVLLGLQLPILIMLIVLTAKSQ